MVNIQTMVHNKYLQSYLYGFKKYVKLLPLPPNVEKELIFCINVPNISPKFPRWCPRWRITWAAIVVCLWKFYEKKTVTHEIFINGGIWRGEGCQKVGWVQVGRLAGWSSIKSTQEFGREALRKSYSSKNSTSDKRSMKSTVFWKWVDWEIASRRIRKPPSCPLVLWNCYDATLEEQCAWRLTSCGFNALWGRYHESLWEIIKNFHMEQALTEVRMKNDVTGGPPRPCSSHYCSIQFLKIQLFSKTNKKFFKH